MKIRIKPIILLAIIIAALFVGYKYAEYLFTNMPSENKVKNESVQVIINKGASTRDIAKVLKEKSLILSDDVFRLKSKIYNYDGRYNFGAFELNKNMSNEEIMKYLTSEDGKAIYENRITIPEGYTAKQIAERLDEKKIVNKNDFISVINSYDLKKYRFLNNLTKRQSMLEGYLFPNTYDVGEKVKSNEVVEKMLNSFNTIFKPEYYDRAREMGYTTDQIIIIASIVEREAKRPEERARIAGVIYNRLKANMRLEMCSTVQYALGEVKEKLYDADLQIDSPYNTYRNDGLPIGPICNPGEESIKAALYPEDNAYKFFVLKDEKTGEHVFSKTFEEHVIAKNMYEK